jgi:hypothetical protein
LTDTVQDLPLPDDTPMLQRNEWWQTKESEKGADG